MYTTEFGNIYFDTKEEALDYVLKKAHYSIAKAKEELADHYIWETVDEEEEEE